MRVLVTGGLGFLGRFVVADLTRAGHEVTVLGRRSGEPPAGVDLIVGDVRELRTVGAFDGLCHLAALTRPRDSFVDPLTYFDVNVGGTVNLLRAVKATSVVFASTNVVLGSGYEGSLHEDLVPRPESPYAASKLAAEHVVAGYAGTGAVGAAILRFFNLAGGPDRDPTRIIPNVFRAITGERPHVTLNGDGSAVRDFVHVLDAARAVRLALEGTKVGAHRTYHIGSGDGTSMAEVVAAAEAITGRLVPVVRAPANPEPQRLVADVTRAGDELGWHPTRSALRTIVTDAWAAWPAADDSGTSPDRTG